MKEIWLPVPYDGFSTKYQISNFGRVKPTTISKYSSTKSEFLKPAKNPRGYYFVNIYHGGKRIQPFIHRLVALAFVPKQDQSHNIVRHLDGNPENNRYDNLAWGDNADNMRDMVEHGNSMRGEKNVRSKITADIVKEIRLRYEGGETQSSLAPLYGIDQTQISRIVLRKLWKHI